MATVPTLPTTVPIPINLSLSNGYIGSPALSYAPKTPAGAVINLSALTSLTLTFPYPTVLAPNAVQSITPAGFVGSSSGVILTLTESDMTNLCGLMFSNRSNYTLTGTDGTNEWTIGIGQITVTTNT